MVNVTSNLSSLRIQGQILERVSVIDTVFLLSSFPTIEDFLASVKDEVVGGKGDIRLRLRRNKTGKIIAVTTDTLAIFSGFEDNPRILVLSTMI